MYVPETLLNFNKPLTLPWPFAQKVNHLTKEGEVEFQFCCIPVKTSNLTYTQQKENYWYFVDGTHRKHNHVSRNLKSSEKKKTWFTQGTQSYFLCSEELVQNTHLDPHHLWVGNIPWITLIFTSRVSKWTAAFWPMLDFEAAYMLILVTDLIVFAMISRASLSLSITLVAYNSAKAMTSSASKST